MRKIGVKLGIFFFLLLVSFSKVSAEHQWIELPDMNFVRSGEGILLKDGRVLIVGGQTQHNMYYDWYTIAEAEIFDPATRTFTITGSTNQKRCGAGLTVLNDGKVLVIGGSGGSLDPPFDSIEVYDPITGDFSFAGDMSITRIYGPYGTILPNGDVLILGGTYEGSYGKQTNIIDKYEVSTGLIQGNNGTLLNSRHSRTPKIRLKNGEILIVGGANYRLPFAELYDPEAKISSLPNSEPFGGDGSYSMVYLPNDKVLIKNHLTTYPEYYNPETRDFEVIYSCGAFPINPYAEGMLLLKTGKVLFIGNQIKLFNPVSEQIEETIDWPQQGNNHGGIVLNDNSVLFFSRDSNFKSYLLTFLDSNQCPENPKLIPPLDGTIIDPNNVVLEWLESNDNQGDPIKYCVTIERADTREDVWMGCENEIFGYNRKMPPDENGCVLFKFNLPISLECKKQYSWTVSALDPNGNWREANTWENFETGGKSFGEDKDKDGIPDHWEENGVCFDEDEPRNCELNEKPTIDLKMLGASPEHPDIFVEIDYIISNKHSAVDGFNFDFEPRKEALQKVVDSFYAHNIHLHIDGGPEFPVSPVLFTKWGFNSKTNKILIDDQVVNNKLPILVESFGTDEVKDEGFERYRNDYFLKNSYRKGIFRYAIFTYGAVKNNNEFISGYCDKYSKSFIVSVEPNDNKQAGTFMHELGHALGLHHGGPVLIAPKNQVELNYKPNNLSVMNYRYQKGLPTTQSDNPFQYSSFALYLNEEHLNEADGLNCIECDFKSYLVKFDTIINGEYKIQTAPPNGPINWNNINSDNELGIIFNVNRDTITHIPLITYNEWNNLLFYNGEIGSFGIAEIPDSNIFEIDSEILVSELNNSKTLIEANLFGPGNLTSIPGGSEILTIKIQNNGMISESFILVADSSLGWADFKDMPSEIDLIEDEIFEFPITVKVPDRVSTEESEIIRIVAISKRNRYITESFKTTVTIAQTDIDDDNDGFTENQGDCNDNNTSIFPGADEIANNGIDEDCSGEDLIDLNIIDQDGDGYSPAQGDCDDNNQLTSPDSEEICDDGIDNNCDGQIDEDCVALVGDLNGDGCVDRTDYNIIIADIRGPEPHNALYDLNGDGYVNISDARYLVTKFTNPKGAPCQ